MKEPGIYFIKYGDHKAGNFIINDSVYDQITDATSGIPVIFLTGKSDKNSVMQVMGLKPQGYLLKTIEKEELLYQIRAFFEKNGK